MKNNTIQIKKNHFKVKFESAEERFLQYIKVYEPEYRKVLILDESNSVEIDGSVYPKHSITPLLECDLCFVIMKNGGIKVLKDRLDFYVRDRIYFAE